MNCLGDILLKNAAEAPERTAVISGERSLTYRQLNEKSNRLANSLSGYGLGSGDRVAVLLGNSIDWLVTWYACHKLGIGVVLVHVRLLPEELARTIELAGAGVLIYGIEHVEKAAYIEANCPSVKRCIACGYGSHESPEGHVSLETLLETGPDTEAQRELRGDEPSVILFTSGTTGVSKGIVRTQEMMSAYARVLAEGSPAGSGKTEVMLTPAPLYHAAGLCCAVKMAVLAGTLVLINGFDPKKICSQIEKHRATQVALVPPVSYQRLKCSGAVNDHDLSSVRLVHITAGKTTAECLADILGSFPNAEIRTSWGSTEASNVTYAVLSREQFAEKPELMRTVGRVNSVSEIKLVDGNGAEPPDGQPGEAYVRSPLVFHGYIDLPEETERCFEDGWFKTEDIMYRDGDGYYYLMDRKRDIVKTGGENVYAQEVERAILTHPSIEDCAVVGIPDPRFGEAIAAAVVLRPGCTLEPEEFIAFCKKSLPSYKKPRYLAIMNQLPENDIGKVQKNVLCRDAAKLFKKIV